MKETEISSVYGNRVRVRACGLCWKDESLLLVNHEIQSGNFWAPPGGGVEFGETIEQTLIREFQEETGLDIVVRNFRFGFEFIKGSLHGIELFFDVEITGGRLITGNDPELAIIKAVQFLDNKDLYEKPPNERHSMFALVSHLRGLSQLNGFHRI